MHKKPTKITYVHNIIFHLVSQFPHGHLNMQLLENVRVKYTAFQKSLLNAGAIGNVYEKKNMCKIFQNVIIHSAIPCNFTSSSYCWMVKF